MPQNGFLKSNPQNASVLQRHPDIQFWYISTHLDKFRRVWTSSDKFRSLWTNLDNLETNKLEAIFWEMVAKKGHKMELALIDPKTLQGGSDLKTLIEHQCMPQYSFLNPIHIMCESGKDIWISSFGASRSKWSDACQIPATILHVTL